MTHIDHADYGRCPPGCESKHGGTFVPWLHKWVCQACFGEWGRELRCPGVHHDGSTDGS